MYKLVVFFALVAMAVAKPSVVTPLGYSAFVPEVTSLSHYSSSVVHGASPVFYKSIVSPAAVYPTVALSQAPHSPAVVLDAVHGVPLDTPEVVAARAAHYHAKALTGVHHLHKRSVVAPRAYRSIVSPVGYTFTTPFVSTYTSPVVAPAPYHVYGKALSVHPW